MTGIRIGAIAGVGIMLIWFGVSWVPSFQRASDPAEYPNCGGNLKSIGTQMLSYSQSHHSKYPDSLEELLLASNGELSAESLICISTSDIAAQGPTTQQIADSLGDLGRPEFVATATSRKPMHLSYIYAAKGLTSNADANYVLVYEPLSNHPGRGLVALFGDGHVDGIPRDKAAAFVAELQAGHNPPRVDLGNQ